MKSVMAAANGLNVKDYIPRLCELDVRFVTITVKALDPYIGARFYKQINFGGRIIRGIDAAQMLISRQLEAIDLLKAANITVKINSVVVPGVNEDYLLFLAKKMGSLKVDLMNFLPLIP